MKRVVYFLSAFLLSQSVWAQDLGKQIVIAPTVGDTLRLIQREHYRLLPAFNDFQWAVFFLTEDSLLNAEIRFKDENGAAADSVIMNYAALSSLRFRLREIDSLSAVRAEILLKDGGLVKGTILRQSSDTLVVETESMGTVRIPKNEIEEMSGQQVSSVAHSLRVGDDPNNISEFVMPTGNTLPAGKGFVGDYELFFLTGGVGVTDWLMANVGLLIAPLSIENEVIDYGVKARLFQVPNRFSIAAGLQLITPFNGSGSSGMWYGVATIGDDAGKASLAYGMTFSPNGGSPVLALSADTRINDHWKFLAEWWIVTRGKWGPLMLGVRFFGRNLSADIGMMHPIGENINVGSPIGWPVGNIVYTF